MSTNLKNEEKKKVRLIISAKSNYECHQCALTHQKIQTKHHLIIHITSTEQYDVHSNSSFKDPRGKN